MKGITFSLHAIEPILATSFQGDPNSDVSYSYIPGSMIRGAVIGRYLRHHKLSELDINDVTVRKLFFDETKTLYLNAYLLSKDGKRTLPVPLSWFKDKDEKLREADERGSMRIYDRAIEYELRDEDITPKRVEQNFCTVCDRSVVLYSEKRRINIHNFRNRKKGKGIKEQGEIFRYEALDAGQTFQAVILCQDKDLLGILQQLIKNPTDIWLGGSQSAGYGKTQIKDKDIKILNDDWCEIKIPFENRANDKKLTITLLSDTILRDEWGQAVADANLVKPAIEETLHQALQTPKSVIIYGGSTLIGGFNRKWGLPLPQIPALLAGSVIVFEGFGLTSEEIQRLEFYGIGNRRNEGFGRVAVNWLDEEELQATKPEKNNMVQPLIEEPSRPIATLIATRILRQRLEKKLIKKLGESDTYIVNLDAISNSQLSRLWLAAREGLITGTFWSVEILLNPDNLTKNAREQFQNTKMKNGDSLHNKVIFWMNNPLAWLIKSQERQELEVTIAPDIKQGLTDNSKNPLIIEYTLRLIMAVAKRAIKEKE
jgi:CRISPR-associated protein Csx10